MKLVVASIWGKEGWSWIPYLEAYEFVDKVVLAIDRDLR